MVFDLTPQGFPFVQAFFGGFFVWLGLNLRIVYIKPKSKTEE